MPWEVDPEQPEDAEEPVVLATGAEAYLAKFGFEPAAPLGLVAPPGSSEALFVRRLQSWDEGVRGQVELPAALQGTTS